MLLFGFTKALNIKHITQTSCDILSKNCNVTDINERIIARFGRFRIDETKLTNQRKTKRSI